MKIATNSEVSRQIGIWIRVSTEDQANGDSPKHHEERARAYAEFNGWTVREVYDLAGVSGKTVMEHPEAKRMLADLKRGHIKALIFSKVARLARNTRELLDFSDRFREAGADMVSIQEKIDTSTPAGRLFYTMVAAMAQWEREEIGDRVRASIGVRARLGKPLNGSAPYGYRWGRVEGSDSHAPKQLIVVPEQAVVVQRLFELFVEHRRKGAVARLLNDAGYRTRQGAKWMDVVVNRVLVNPCTKGTYVYNVTRKTGAWKSEDKPEEQWSTLKVEPIVTAELWAQANQILESQEKRPARVGKCPVRPFAGVIICKCGRKMYIPSGSRKYMCYTQKKRVCKTSIDAQTLDAIFCEQLKAYFVAPERIAAHLAKARDGMAEREARLGTHRSEVEKVRADMAKTHQLYLDGHIPKEGYMGFYQPLAARLRQLQDELPRIEAEVAHLKVTSLSAEEIVNEARHLYSRWPTLADADKVRIVQSIVERITVGEGEIEITLSHLPSSEELTKSQQLL
jgi:site-specific DNA recombinase